MTVADLINAVPQNVPLNVDGTDAGECTAVAHKWEQMLGLPLVLGNAVDTYANADPSLYTKTLNTPDNVPAPGAVMVWNQNDSPDTETSAFGHTAVFISGDSNTFTSFDQNFPTGTNPHEQSHSYDGVVGWFYPNVLNNNGDSTVSTIATAEIVDELAHAFLNSDIADNPGLQVYVGQAVEDVISQFNSAPERAQYLAQIEAWQAAAAQPTDSTPVPVTVAVPTTTTPLPEPPDPVSSDPVVVPVPSSKTTLLQKLESNVHLIVGAIAYVTTLVGALKGFLTASDTTGLLAVITASVSAVIHGKVTS